MSQFSIKASALAVALSAAVSVAPTASAQQFAQLSSAPVSVGQFLGMNEDGAYATRNDLHRKIDAMHNPAMESGLKAAVDGSVEALFPGIIQRKQDQAREAARVAEEDRQRNAFNPGPCPKDARICVDLDGHRSWLQDPRGNIEYVAASGISSGKPGQDTPRGTFTINRKVRDEVSYIYGNAPMPYSMYFTHHGHAFHQGSPAIPSAGCIHLAYQDAVRYWDSVNSGDKVFIY